MEIKPSQASSQTSATSAPADSNGPLAQLPRGVPLTAVVEKSIAATQQLAELKAQLGQSARFDTLLNIDGNKVQTQSNQAFSAGQVLKVEVNGSNGLRILAVISQPAGESANSATQQIQQGLRQALPIQQGSALLLNNLIPAFKLLSSSQYLEAKNQLRAILATIPNIKDLANPAALRQQVNQSGSFFENNVKQALSALQRQLAAGHINSPSTPGVNPLHAKAHPQATPNKVSTEQFLIALRNNTQIAKQLGSLVDRDFKAQLLKLAGSLIPIATRPGNTASASPAETGLLLRILQALPVTAGSTSSNTGATSLNLANLPINTQIQQLLLNPALFAGHPQAHQNSNTAAPNQTTDLAVSTLLRQIAATLARVQSNQLQSLNAGRIDTDGSTLLNSWNIEIPAFIDGQFKPIQLQIHEERHPDAPPSENRKHRQWKITLGFDFEELGEFFATLRIVDNSISATFWSERPSTLQRINSELQHLNKSLHKLGLNVEELECRHGKPVLQETRLDQQLVDIKT